MNNTSSKVDLQYLGDFDPVKKATELISAGKSAERIERERDWYINYMWFRGQPYVARNYETGKIAYIPPEDRVHAKSFNMLLPRVRTLIGNETFVPKFRARNAAAMGTEDQMRVRGVEDVANHVTRAARLNRQKRRADLYKHLFGLCWFKIGWDPTKGPIKAITGQVPCPTCNGTAVITGFDGQEAGCPICGAQGLLNDGMSPGQVEGIVGSAPEGEVSISVAPPWEIVCDTSADDIFDCRWLIHERTMDRALAFELFCVDTGLQLEDIPRGSKIGSDMANFMSGVDGRRVGNGQDTVTVRELWHMPTPSHQRGVHAVIVGGVVARGGPNPWEHGKLPFVPYRCYEDPGHFYPTSTCDALVPINAQYNEMMTKFTEFVDMGNIMRLLVEDSVGLTFDDVPGIVRFSHKPSKPEPKFLQSPGVPPDVYQWLDRANKGADELSAVSDVMRGQMQTAEPNAQYSAFIEQRTQTPLRMMYEDNQDSLTEVARLAVDTAKLMYKNGRLLRDVFGAGGNVVMREFRLEQAGSSSDVEIIPERDVGRSVASRRAEIIEANKAGVFQDPRLMKLMEYATDDEVYDDMVLDEQVAQLDVESVDRWDPASGAPAPMLMARMFEDHVVHIRVKRRALNRMRTTYGQDDPRCSLMEQNLLQHQAMALTEQQMVQQAQTEQAAQFGLANAQNPAMQPADVQAAAGGPVADGMVSPPPPGPPGTQPTLGDAAASVDQAAAQGGLNAAPVQ